MTLTPGITLIITAIVVVFALVGWPREDETPRKPANDWYAYFVRLYEHNNHDMETMFAAWSAALFDFAAEHQSIDAAFRRFYSEYRDAPRKVGT